MSTATKGRAFEYEVRDYMRSLGWWVIRAASSKGFYDLVCLPSTDSLFPGIEPSKIRWNRLDGAWVGVSCKSGAARESKNDRADKAEAARIFGGACLFVRRRSGRLKPGEDRWIMEWG
jgi:hypothetical protein